MSMVVEPLFRRITFEEAKECVAKWHNINRDLDEGKDCFGVERNGKLIAAAIFVDCRAKEAEQIGQLIATCKDPDEKFQMSQLLKYCRQQLRKQYSLLLTYCDIRKSNGGQLKGDYWKYSGITKNVSLEPSWEMFLDMLTYNKVYGFHLYWVPLNKAGNSIACAKGLESLPYPK